MAIKSISFNIKIEPALHRELLRLAKAADRTLAAETRVAIRRHINMERLNGNDPSASPEEAAPGSSTTGG